MHKLSIYSLLSLITIGSIFAASKDTDTSIPVSSPSRYSDQSSKKELVNATAPQFSGVLYAAHRHGFTGKKQTAIVVTIPTPNEKRITSTAFETKFKEKIRVQEGAWLTPSTIAHDLILSDILFQIAPDSHIALVQDQNQFDAMPFLLALNKDKELTAWIQNASVVNYSVGSSAFMLSHYCSEQEAASMQKEQQKQKESFKSLVTSYGKQKLLLVAAGNENRSLSLPLSECFAGFSVFEPSHVFCSDPELMPYTLVVGALDQTSQKSRHSNYPGSEPFLQENFLYGLGEEIKISPHKKASGTSYATPTVAGVILLLKEAYPHFSSLEIKEIILESARRNFYINYPNNGKVKVGTFVYDPKEKSPNLSGFKEEEFDMEAEEFDPYYYGKGILDTEAAFIYADLKTETPHLPPSELRRKMKKVLEDYQQEAATKIQLKFRKYRARKHLATQKLLIKTRN